MGVWVWVWGLREKSWRCARGEEVGFNAGKRDSDLILIKTSLMICPIVCSSNQCLLDEGGVCEY